MLDRTTFAFYGCTSGNGKCGQPRSVTNALGHVTTFNVYNKDGQLTSKTDPNGLVTQYTYKPRGRLATVTRTPPAGGGNVRVLAHTYSSRGQVLSTTYPDGVVLSFAYNACLLYTSPSPRD